MTTTDWQPNGRLNLKVRWLAQASSDLQQVEAYIAQDDPRAALRIVLRVIDAVSHLKDNPGMGRAGRIDGTRELVVSDTPFLVPYRVKGDWIEILRVFHHARKWPEDL